MTADGAQKPKSPKENKKTVNLTRWDVTAIEPRDSTAEGIYSFDNLHAHNQNDGGGIFPTHRLRLGERGTDVSVYGWTRRLAVVSWATQPNNQVRINMHHSSNLANGIGRCK